MSTPTPFEDAWKTLQETSRLLKEQSQETDRRFQENERRSQEADRRFQETDRRLRELDKQIGRLGNRLGDFVQEMVAPSVVQLFADRGLQVHQLARNVQAKRNGQAMQIDLMVLNDDVVVLVEVKSALSVDDVNEHLQRLAGFKTVFPRYADAGVMGAVAAMVIPDNVASYAYHQGLFVLGQRGETMQILNDAQFQPRTW